MKTIFYIIFGALIVLCLQAIRAGYVHDQLQDVFEFDPCPTVWRDIQTWDSNTWSWTKTYWLCKE